jgi:bacterial/archaeal transporter family-2 protein
MLPPMTSQILLLALAFLIGAGIALQALINTRLQVFLGGATLTAIVSFIVGTIGLLLVAWLQRPAWPVGAMVRSAPWWTWTGGLLGATYIVIVVQLVPRMSSVLLFAMIILGQMCLLVVCEAVGAFGVKPYFTLARLGGIALIVAGAALCKR